MAGHGHGDEAIAVAGRIARHVNLLEPLHDIAAIDDEQRPQARRHLGKRKRRHQPECRHGCHSHRSHRTPSRYAVTWVALTFFAFKSHANKIVTPSPSPPPHSDRPTAAGGGTATISSAGCRWGMLGKRAANSP